jgi:prepilin-type N-terminal cleavage/methylation domain-containing protein
MDNKQDKGFTLVELLIVIVILGILATVTVFAVRGITDQGQNAACNADKKTMQTAVEAYFAQEGGTSVPGADAAARAQSLVTAGFLVSGSDNYQVNANGSLVYAPAIAPATTNPCGTAGTAVTP